MGELKNLDLEGVEVLGQLWSAGWIEPNGTRNCLNSPGEGTANGQRVGRRIRLKDLLIRYQVEQPQRASAGATNSGGIVRFIVVMDTQSQGVSSAATGTLVMEDQVWGVPGAAKDAIEPAQMVCSFRNLENVQRFKILKDVTIPVAPVPIASEATDTMEAQGAVIQGSCFIDMKLTQVNFEDGAITGILDDIRDNSINIYAIWSDSNASSLPTFRFVSRLRYFDG